MGVPHLLLMILLAGGVGEVTPQTSDSTGFAMPPDWVVWLPGTGLPLILSAPHGGREEPSGIPNRDSGCWTGQQCVWTHHCGTTDTNNCKSTTVTDLYTKELAIKIREDLCRLCGSCPALVYSNLRRRKLDPNREREEAAFGVPEMEAAWDAYHGYINQSREALLEGALLLDIHGHGHKIQRAELGYLVSGALLDSGNVTAMSNQTSIRSLGTLTGVGFEELLRGNQSFGGLMAVNGYPSVPSPEALGPGGAKYFSGGFITKRYGSRDGGFIDAIQIESAGSHRKSQTERDKYALALAMTIKQYLEIYYLEQSDETTVRLPDVRLLPATTASMSSSPPTTASISSSPPRQLGIRSITSCISYAMFFSLLF